MRREPSFTVKGLSYCATKDGKTMLCFIQWPSNTDQNSIYYIDDEIRPDGPDWVCGRWRIEMNSPLDEDRFTAELQGLRSEEKREKVDFDKNMALAEKVLSEAIERRVEFA